MDMLSKVIIVFSALFLRVRRAITVLTVLHCVQCFDGWPLCLIVSKGVERAGGSVVVVCVMFR